MASKKVYVIGPEDGPYKIGISGDVKRRIADLQTGAWSKLQLICSCDGTEALELELHHRFKKYRLQGEWFDLKEEQLQELRKIMIKPSPSDFLSGPPTPPWEIIRISNPPPPPPRAQSKTKLLRAQDAKVKLEANIANKRMVEINKLKRYKSMRHTLNKTNMVWFPYYGSDDSFDHWWTHNYPEVV